MAETLGARVRRLRQHCQLTQAQLATKAGVTQQALSRYEHNTHEMSVRIALKLARALGVSMDVLTGFWDQAPDEDEDAHAA